MRTLQFRPLHKNNKQATSGRGQQQTVEIVKANKPNCRRNEDGGQKKEQEGQQPGGAKIALRIRSVAIGIWFSKQHSAQSAAAQYLLAKYNTKRWSGMGKWSCKFPAKRFLASKN